MKKVLAISLALLLVFAAVVPVFAATPRATCSHTYRYSDSQVVYRYVNSDVHRQYTVLIYVCTKCGNVDTRENAASLNSPHKYTLASASCNGYTQTRTMRCSQCYTSYNTYVTCPKAPHTGNCPVLPI